MPIHHIRRLSCIALIILCAAAVAQSGIPAAEDTTAAEKPPLSVGILVDSSADRWAGASAVKSAVSQFLRSMREEDEYALFSAGPAFRLEQEFTDDPALAETSIGHMQLRGESALYDSVVAAIGYMTSEVSNDHKALLLFTSGEDAGSRARLSDAAAAARQADVPVFVVAIPEGTWRSHDDISQLASQTSGTALMPAKKSELDEVSEAFARRLFGPPLPKSVRRNGRKPLAAYSQLIVRSIPVAKTADTADLQKGDNLLLQKLLVSRLQAKQVFPEVVDATDTTGEDVRGPVESAAPRTKLELLGTIIGYKRGSHLKRGTAGVLGSGVARVKVQFVVRDAATRKPVLSFVKQGSGSSGLLGGGNEDNEIQAMLRVVNASIEELKRNH